MFEGLRAALTDHVFRGDLMIQAFVINAVLFASSILVFLWLLRRARVAGTLLQMGE